MSSAAYSASSSSSSSSSSTSSRAQASFMQGESNHQALLNAIITNPAVAMKTISTFARQFSNAVNKKGFVFSRENLQPLFDALEAQCPLFLLNECEKEGSGVCTLSRSYCPKYRSCFEQRGAEGLLYRMNATLDYTHYADFASGGNYQALVIIVLALAKKPDARLCIHLIDTENIEHIGVREKLGMTREISPDRPIPFARVRGEERDKARLALQERRHLQFISFLRSCFPRADISLHIHDTVESYLALIAKNSLPYPDAITSADIETTAMADDELPGICAYIELCNQTSKNKPHSFNLLLSKDDKGGARIGTLSRGVRPFGTGTLVEDPADQDGIIHYGLYTDLGRAPLKSLIKNCWSKRESMMRNIAIPMQIAMVGLLATAAWWNSYGR